MSNHTNISDVFAAMGIEFDDNAQKEDKPYANMTHYDVDADISRIAQQYSRDTFFTSDITLNDEAFIALLAMEGRITYHIKVYDSIHKVAWFYDGNSTVTRCEAAFDKNVAYANA